MLSLPFLLLAGCGGGDKPDATDPTGGDADADTDADTDSDTDADADTDADTDPSDTSTVPIGPEPECDDAPSQPIAEGDFLALYEEKYCWAWASCGAAGPCPGPPVPEPGCAFDPDPGCACLDANWACVGGEPVPAPSCGQVYACRDTGWWIDTGRDSGGGSGGSGGGSGG